MARILDATPLDPETIAKMAKDNRRVEKELERLTERREQLEAAFRDVLASEVHPGGKAAL